MIMAVNALYDLAKVSIRLQITNQRYQELMARSGKVHRIGGYVWGKTSKDDLFILLYDKRKGMNFKVCRVYPHQFKDLPPFINTDAAPQVSQNDNLPGDNINKDAAIDQRIYHACPTFVVGTIDGTDSGTMGPEQRFYDTIEVESSRDELNDELYAMLGRNTPQQAPPESAYTHNPVVPTVPEKPYRYNDATIIGDDAPFLSRVYELYYKDHGTPDDYAELRTYYNEHKDELNEALRTKEE